MNEQRRGLSTGLFALFALLFVFLCAGMSVGGFLIGRQTASVSASESVVEVTVPVEVTREVIVEVEVDRQENGAAALPTSTPMPSEPAGDEDAATADEGNDPDAEPLDGDQIVPMPTPTFEPGERGEFTEEDLEILFEAWEVIERSYDGQLPSDEDLRYAIVEYAITTLGDDFTRFVRPEIAERSRERISGEYSGIGALVQDHEEGGIEIVRPFDGSPADIAGLETGDVIVAVDGESVIDFAVDDAVPLILGPEGTPVTLTVVRSGVSEPFDITIVRARIVIPLVEAEMLPGNIAHVELFSFLGSADEQLEAALNMVIDEGAEGIILDLRNNPGGLLNGSIVIADLFLPEGVIARERNSEGLDEVFRSEDGDIAEGLPLVVLVNERSASASEIVAGAIQDRDRGIVIGEQTFGKGTVQNVVDLSDGSQLRVTIARWFTPDNQSIEGQGITPDIIIETPEGLGSDLGGENDTQLQRAIQYLLDES